ncbi:endonuclease/exonuclease/phosphatase family protein [Sagittula sp. SSi028]|uniref:endonuclease/exonuclease/phosphatase family protein n=1 Tax=Sagittula sp. SSi028 TaxID=3400636 RepID=UPI003AF4DC76
MLVAAAASAQVRVATWHGDFSEKGPGLLLRELLRGKVDIAPILTAAPDVLLLTRFDFDASHAALAALQIILAEGGLDLPHAFSKRPNTGWQTGADLDGDGRLGGPRDAQGYGWFSGQGGMAVLSRYPITLERDLSGLLWRDAPHSLMTAQDTAPEIQRLSSVAHWLLRLDTPDGPIRLMTLAATPPVFDGPEDRNGRRNHDEVMLWAHVLNGKLGETPAGPVIVAGLMNIDPTAGEGLRQAIKTVLGHPGLQDPLPDRATVTWDSTGPMRVSYVLPDRQLRITDAGVVPPLPETEHGQHALVWVDVTPPDRKTPRRGDGALQVSVNQ